MSKLFMIFLVLLLMAALAVVLLAAVVSDADAATDCPPPAGLRPAIWLPLLGQDHYAGMWSCFEHPYLCLDR